MNTYNISVNERVVLQNVPEKNVEMRKEQIAEIMWMKSKEPNIEAIKNSIDVTLNTEPLQLFD
mgnify:FL=1|tara:strand:+ start:236 stop:424 length:189 start_codon:yes stop_codon:yes gene_type:complete